MLMLMNAFAAVARSLRRSVSCVDLRPFRIWLTLVALPLASSYAPAEPTLELNNNRLLLSVDLALQGDRCHLRDLWTGEYYPAVDFGVIRAWDNVEDRIRTLVISPDDQTFTCHVSIDKNSDTHAIIHVDTRPDISSGTERTSFGVAFDVELRIEKDMFEYAIPIASLHEQQDPQRAAQRWRLMSIELFPHLGATPSGFPGYLVIPSGSGAIYYFDRNHPRANTELEQTNHADLSTETGLIVRWNSRPDAPAEHGSMMYGIQAAQEDQLHLPFYGTIRSSGGLMGILISGEYDTELRARRNQGPGETASINPIFHYRRFPHSKLDPVDRQVRLIALQREQGNYAVMANLFRNYLMKERNVKTLQARAKTNPDVKCFIDAVLVRVIMDGQDGATERPGKTRSCISWDEVADGIQLFQNAGFQKINFILAGVRLKKKNDADAERCPLHEEHGSEQAFRQMVDRINEAGYRVTIRVDDKYADRSSADWDPASIQINEYGNGRLRKASSGRYAFQRIPGESFRQPMKNDLLRLESWDLQGMQFGGTWLSVMEETFPPNQVLTRRQYGQEVIADIKDAAERFGTVGCESGSVPLLGVIVSTTKIIYPHAGAPAGIRFNGYCEAALIDHWVPIQHMILHGLCCYAGGPELAGRAGARFEGVPTRKKVDEFRRHLLEYQEWGSDLDYEFITDHHSVAPGVSKTTLSGGTQIWVNRTEQDWSGPDRLVKSRGHLVERGRK